MNLKPIRPVPVDTSCCSGYKDFTFYGITFPESYTVYNSTASNYIHATVEAIGLQAFRITFPSLTASELDAKSVQIIGTTSLSTTVLVGYNNNNTIDISWDDLGALNGLFTIRIWINHITPIV